MPGEATPPGYNPPPNAPQQDTPGGYPPPGGGYPPQDGGYPPAGGGYPPAGGGYPPPGGYPPGGGGYHPGGPAPAGFANNDEKTWALVAHFGGAAGALISFGPLGFVGPLIAYVAKGQQSPTVKEHARAALNFQLLWSIIAFVVLFFSWCLLFIPSLIIFVIQIVFGILGGLKANEGSFYKYPMSANIIK